MALRALAGPALAWIALLAAALWARPLMPVDETRYLSVAWEMSDLSARRMAILGKQGNQHSPRPSRRR